MRFRRFKRKKYRLADTTMTRSAAMSAARGFRGRGDSVRVIELKAGGHQVWVRDIPSRRKSLGYS